MSLSTRIDSPRAVDGVTARAGSRFPARAALLLLCALFLGMAGLYTWIIPPLEGFDASAHYMATLYWREFRSPPPLDEATAQYSYELIAQPPLYHALAALAGAGWPLEESKAFVEASRNPYHAKVLSKRQTVTLPGTPLDLLMPIALARGVAMLGGLLAVLATWVLARSFFPRLPSLALAASALVAFNPQFLFMSATITPDPWAAATVAWSVTLAACAYARDWPARRWAWAGVAGGVALLTKYSAFLAGAPALVLLVALARRRGAGHALRAAAFALLGGLIAAGPWLLRNLLLYGELIPLKQMAVAIPTLNRAEPFTLDRTWDYVPWLIASYWGVFVSNIAPGWYLETTRVFIWMAAAGLAVFLLRRWSDRLARRYLAVAVSAAWFAVVALAVLYWTRTVEYGEQGRLAHIAAPALALLFALGWQGWLPERRLPALHVGLAGFALLLAGSQLWTLHDAYHMPPSLNPVPAFDRAYDVAFDGGMRLLGADFPGGEAIAADQPLRLTLYFTADHEIEDHYTLFLHLADEGDRILYQYDGVPAARRHSTRQWQPGEVFADEYLITVDDIAADDLATLSIGFYPVDDPTMRLNARDASGASLGDRVVLAQIRVHDAYAPTPFAQQHLDAVWEQGIALAAADVQFGSDGEPRAVAVTWQAEADVAADYTVFVQALNEDGDVIAQVDQQPHDGEYPTSTWAAGDVIKDAYTLVWPAADENAPAWRQVIIGLYAQDGTRLRLVEPDAATDFYTLARHE